MPCFDQCYFKFLLDTYSKSYILCVFLVVSVLITNGSYLVIPGIPGILVLRCCKEWSIKNKKHFTTLLHTLHLDQLYEKNEEKEDKHEELIEMTIRVERQSEKGNDEVLRV